MRTCRDKLLVQEFLKVISSALLVVKYIERKVSGAIFSALSVMMKYIERKVSGGIFLALLVAKDIEGKVKEVMIKEDDMVMKCVLNLKDLYGKILEEQAVPIKDKGIVLLIF